MRLTALTLRDFMGYEEADIDLASVGATVVVGDNGSGKSTLLDAITWALYDRVTRDVASQDALIRDGTDQATVVVSFTSGTGHDVTVLREKARGRTGTLSLAVDDQPRTSHTQAETRAIIASLIGLTYDAFMAGPVMAQETAGAFMKARPAERKDLLVHLFGLDEFEPLHVEAKKQATAQQAKAEMAEAMLRSASEIIAVEAEAKANVERTEAEFGTLQEAQSLAADRIIAHKATLAATESAALRHTTAASRIGNLTAWIAEAEGSHVQHSEAIRDLKGKVANLSNFVEPDLPPLVDEADITRLRLSVEAAETADKKRTGLQSKAERMEADIARMRQACDNVATVPCGAGPRFASCQFLRDVPTEEWVERAVLARRDLLDEIEELRLFGTHEGETRAALDALQTRARQAEVEHTRVNQQRTGRASLIAAYEQNLASHYEAIDANTNSRERWEADLAVAMAERSATTIAMRERQEATEALAMAASAYAAHRTAANATASLLAAYRADLVGVEQAKRDHERWSATLAENAEKRDVYRLLAEAFHRDGIPSLILAEGIPAIEEEANAVLEGLPGGLTLALRTQREKKGGGMADTLDVVVTVGGWEREYGMLSVGQRFRVDLALRLGLSRVLTRRGGGRVDTLWLDEPLAALDASGREAVMETLSALAVDFGLLVVVSHHPDFNDRFGGRIEVSMEDGVSTAVLVA